MKKVYLLTTIMVLSLILFFSMSGCTDSNRMKKYTAYAVSAGENEAGESGSPSGINMYKNTHVISEPKEKTIKVSFLGKEYAAEYVQSVSGRLGGEYYTFKTLDEDYITISSAGDIVEFNSSLCKHYYIKEYSCSENEAEIIRTKAIEAASEWVREIYGDNLGFKITPIVSDVITTNTIRVRFKLNEDTGADLPYRYVLGQISFNMTIDCELLDYITSDSIYKIKGKSVPEDFTIDKVREIVSNMAFDEKTKIELQCDVDNWDNKQFDVFPLYDGRLVCRTYVYLNGNTDNRVEVIIPLE